MILSIDQRGKIEHLAYVLMSTISQINPWLFVSVLYCFYAKPVACLNNYSMFEQQSLKL